MKLNIEEKVYREVTLTNKQMVEVTERTIRKVYNLDSESYINSKGDLVFDIKYHNWEEEVIRVATEEDIMALKMIDTIKKLHK